MAPRGRIYLIKQVLEGKPATASTQLHLDRCLTCRNCETTCPSGVQYGRLVDIGRKIVDQQVPRPFAQSIKRKALQELLPRKWLFTPAMKAGQMLRLLLPRSLKNKVPQAQAAGAWPHTEHVRKMLLLDGLRAAGDVAEHQCGNCQGTGCPGCAIDSSRPRPAVAARYAIT